VLATADARSKGYWKHQYKVYESGKGHAHEAEEDLQGSPDHPGYPGAIWDHFYTRGDDYAIQIHGTTYSDGPDWLSFDDALASLSVRGSAGMYEKAKAQLLALLLNVVSGKVATYHTASEDGATVSQVIAYTADLLEDSDPTTDELAKDLAEYVNVNELIPEGLVPHGTPDIAYRRAGASQAGLFFVRPNPSGGATWISYSVPKTESRVTLGVYDLAGRRVRVLVDENKGAGSHHVTWDGRNEEGQQVQDGVYFSQLRVDGERFARRMILIR
jgi:hypothetical protein